MFFYDSTWLLVLPGLILGVWAQVKVKHAYEKYGKIGTRRGISANQVARELLSRSGNGDVSVTAVSGSLTDHYDPRSRTLALSDGGSQSIAAIGVAAHECGHAMQAGAGYGPLKLRTAIVPVVNFGSRLYFPIFLLGIVLSWGPLMTVGIACFALSLVFSLISLPVEFNASRRAVAALSEGNYVSDEEMRGVRAVLAAAALTYVAAAVSSLLQLVRLILISRNRD
jgi:Zn-dependent membrane protease YugP